MKNLSGPSGVPENQYNHLSSMRIKVRDVSAKFAVALVVLAAIMSGAVSVVAQIRLVSDVNHNEIDDYLAARYFRHHESTGARSFFITDSNELWTSDGTAAGTVLVKGFSDITDLEVCGNVVFISGFNYESGRELWKSDGTPGGTVLVKDIFPGSGDASPSFLTNVNGVLYFSANNSVNGRELWRSDGTSAGTVMVKDVKLGALSSNVKNIVSFNGGVLFVADDGNVGYELWRSDGTDAGTALVKDIHHESGKSGAPGSITVANGIAFFSATAPGIDRQLWKSDGTTAGTSLVKIIRPGGYSAKINKVTAVADNVFFEATDGVHGIELWKSDGTEAGTVLVKDITPGPGSNATYASEHINHLTGANGKLFFTATPDNMIKLYVSDGTSAGTKELTADHVLSFSFINPGFAQVNGGVLFFAISWEDGLTNLYFSDGNTVTMIKKTVAPAYSTNPQFQSVEGSVLFFAEQTFYKTNLSSAGTVPVKNLHRKGSSDPRDFTDAGGTLFFTSTNDYPGAIYKTDGTPGGTIRLKDLILDHGMAGLNGRTYFTAAEMGSQIFLPWTSDGTPEGTVPLTNEVALSTDFTTSNGLVFFSAANSSTGRELWKTDGTQAGTSIVKDVKPLGDSNPRHLTSVNNMLFFAAATSAAGNELWKTDGTELGTVMVTEIRPGSASTEMNNFVAGTDRLYFLANDIIHGPEVWTSNGTPEGTFMVTDQDETFLLRDDQRSSYYTVGNTLYFVTVNSASVASLWKTDGNTPVKLKEFDLNTGGIFDKVFIIASTDKGVFLARRAGSSFELWRSWGTAGTTVKIRTFRNTDFWDDSKVAVLNNVIYFSAGETVWRSDGNASGTYQLPFHGESKFFTASGPYVYFNGESIEYGNEPFLIDEHSVSASSQVHTLIESTSNDNFTASPNPFRSAFVLHVKGHQNETFDVEVVAMDGRPQLRGRKLLCNEDHSIGEQWTPGVYVVRVMHENKLATSKMIKVN